MSKYGISHSVVDTYIRDFHGVTLTFYKQHGRARRIAACTDCHGIHDITRTDHPDSPKVMANLTKKCQACHPNAPEDFPKSWVPHSEASFVQAPGVFAVNLLYKILIPFMMVGLFLQILLHIWRLAVKR